MSEKKFIKKRYILIFVLLIVLLHLAIYVTAGFRFNGTGIKKPINALAIYSKSKEVTIFRRLLEHLFVKGSMFGHNKILIGIETANVVNETESAVTVDG